jgi:hypothetical protein
MTSNQSVVSIHQPNFFPWLGYFDKMARCDYFVFLDDVQIQKTGGGWSNRVKILVSGQPKWVSAPIDRDYHGVREVRETVFKAFLNWRNDILRTLQISYKKAPHYRDAIELIEPLLMNREDNLAAYNSAAIVRIAEELGIATSKCRWSSKLEHSGRSNGLLVSIVKALGASTYLCGGGAEGYQDKDVFDEASIALVHQGYEPRRYSQVGTATFAPGLSVIDVLMNVGIEGARQMLAEHLSYVQN